jgi:hypothetical protein
MESTLVCGNCQTNPLDFVEIGLFIIVVLAVLYLDMTRRERGWKRTIFYRGYRWLRKHIFA